MENLSKHPRKVKKVVIWSFIGLLLVGTGGAGVYYHLDTTKKYQDQQAKLERDKQKLDGDKQKAEKALTVSEAQVSTLKTTNLDLQKQIDQMKAPVKIMPTVALKGSGHWGDTILGGGNDFLLVDVTIKNPSAQSTYLSLHDFKLKDDQNNTQPIYSQSAVASQPRFATGVENLPGGKIELRGQDLDGGETVSGTLIFYVRVGVTHYTLTYNGQTFSLKV